ncbi:hypothetical protein JXA80_03235, partial [bacterium]|nr:hypothetical protein [candidate division CSSED10-310 bacterium]
MYIQRATGLVYVLMVVLSVGCVSAEEWRTQVLDESMINGWNNAMTRDTQGYLHIVTYDYVDEEVEYLYENATGWHVESIAEVYMYETGTAIALDSGNAPHVCFFDDDTDSIRYATRNQSGWSVSTVVSPDSYVRHIAMVLTSADVPHVLFNRFNDNLIKCADWNGSQWVIGNAAAGFSPMGRPARFAAVIDENDRIHISFVNYSASDLVYSYRDDSGWHEETVDAGLIRGDYAAMVIDSMGQPWIAYTTDTENNDGRYAVTLKYARKTSSGWQTGMIDDTPDTGDYVAMALKGNGNPAVGYYDLENEYVKFATFNGTAWQREFVDTSGSVGIYLCMTVDGNDHARIAYYDAENLDLKMATQTATGWQMERPVTTGLKGLHHWLVIDANDYPHIGYSGGGPEDLKYAWMDDSGWHIETVDVTGKSGVNVGLQLDSSGYPHFIHGDESTLTVKYRWKDAAGWHSDDVVTGMSNDLDVSFCLDMQNTPHVCYKTADGLIHSYRNAQGAWQPQPVDTEGETVYDFLLQVDSSGRPCIVYSINGKLKYTRWTGSAWMTDIVASYSTLFGDPSFALDSQDHPHIVFNDSSDHQIQYYYYDGSQWKMETVDSVGNFIYGKPTVVAVNAADVPFILFDSTDADEITFYFKEGDTWNSEACITGGSITHGCFAIDSNNIPFIAYYNRNLSCSVRVPEKTGVQIVMPATTYIAGDFFSCDAVVANDALHPLTGYPLFVIMEAYGMFFFAPSFNSVYDCYLAQYPAFVTGRTTVPVL